MGGDYLKLTDGMCGSKCSLDRGAAEYPTNRPHTFRKLTDGSAVCNCPRGGNEAMQIEVTNLW